MIQYAEVEDPFSKMLPPCPKCGGPPLVGYLATDKSKIAAGCKDCSYRVEHPFVANFIKYIKTKWIKG